MIHFRKKKDSRSQFGNNYLLVIGIDKYYSPQIPNLENATKDCKDLIEILLERYNFSLKNTISLFNNEATAENIISKLDKLAEITRSSDNLLIYFAGHGYYKKDRRLGYLIPYDGDTKKIRSLILHSEITEYIRSIKSHHTFLIVDSCFSGALLATRTLQDSEILAERIGKFPSRIVLTAGLIEEVSDGIRGSNSPFATAVIEFLKVNESIYFPASELIQYVKRVTPRNAKQTPISGRLYQVGDLDGEFIFALKQSKEKPLSLKNHQQKDFIGLDEKENIPEPLDSIILSRYQKIIGAGLFFTTLTLILLFLFWKTRLNEMDEIENKIIPTIQSYIEDPVFGSIKAFPLALKIEENRFAEQSLANLWPKFTKVVAINSEPIGAKVYWKDYSNPNEEWFYLGETPLNKTRIPLGLSQFKIEKKGFYIVNHVQFKFVPTDENFKLHKIGDLPENMVFVPGGKSGLKIVGLEHIDMETISDFLIDKFEVTNKEYKQFVLAGGYKDKSYWKYNFVYKGEIISWEKAMAFFVDPTGQPGPASWEIGDYKSGMDDHPVTGISWYEAAAYAQFVGKDLPTIYHWSKVAETWANYAILPLSNFNNNGSTKVGAHKGMTGYGTFDMAGNAREWCFNGGKENGHRYLLGGGWDDPTYQFSDIHTQDAFDRYITNGFRCIKYLESRNSQLNLAKLVEPAFRDYTSEKPISIKSFEIIKRQFEYDRIPLEGEVEKLEETENHWICEKISFTANYGHEKMIAYLYLPKDTPPPYETVIFFPNSGAIYTREFDANARHIKKFEFLLKSGRAVMFPIYYGTYERGGDVNSDIQDESFTYRDQVILWTKDFRRSIDYLETRQDINVEKIAFYGDSWGGTMGSIILAVENRIKVGILLLGGLMMQSTSPEADPINFLPRVNVPVLMLNGEHDQFCPVETSQKPMFNLLGTPKENKKHVIYENIGHTVPQNELIKETLFWLEKYLTQ